MSVTDKIMAYLEAELNLDAPRSDIVRYGLQSVLFTLAGVIAVLIPAALLGLFYEAVIVLLTIMAYRKISGGAHCTTAGKCLVTGTVAALALAYLATVTAPLFTGSVAALLLPPFLSLPVTYLFAPADVPQKPITSKQQRKMLRALTFLFLIGWMLLGTASLFAQSPKLGYIIVTGNLGILWQTFLLTPPGFRFINSISQVGQA